MTTSKPPLPSPVTSWWVGWCPAVRSPSEAARWRRPGAPPARDPSRSPGRSQRCREWIPVQSPDVPWFPLQTPSKREKAQNHKIQWLTFGEHWLPHVTPLLFHLHGWSLQIRLRSGPVQRCARAWRLCHRIPQVSRNRTWR